MSSAPERVAMLTNAEIARGLETAVTRRDEHQSMVERMTRAPYLTVEESAEMELVWIGFRCACEEFNNLLDEVIERGLWDSRDMTESLMRDPDYRRLSAPATTQSLADVA